MAYTITKVETDTDSVIVHVTIDLGKGEVLEIPIPAYRPKSEEQVLETVDARVAYEVGKADRAPILADIKAKLTAKIGTTLGTALGG